MNKSGQFQAIGIFIQVVFGIFFWVSGFAEQITFWTQRVIEAEGLTGLTAFMLSYMNLWVFLAMMIMVSIGANIMEGRGQ
jgi:hypothetical protein